MWMGVKFFLFLWCDLGANIFDFDFGVLCLWIGDGDGFCMGWVSVDGVDVVDWTWESWCCCVNYSCFSVFLF